MEFIHWGSFLDIREAFELMMYQNFKLISFATVALSAIALSGCGGGGSGVAGGPTTQFASVGTQANSAEGRAQITAAAGNVPKAGSVTQSSNANSGVTADAMSVTVSTHEGQLRYVMAYIDSNNNSSTIDSNNIEVLARGSGEGYKFVELKDEDTDGAVYIDVYTD